MRLRENVFSLVAQSWPWGSQIAVKRSKVNGVIICRLNFKTYSYLFKLLKHVTIPQGGVIPHIQPELLRRKDGNKFSLPQHNQKVKNALQKAQNAGVQKPKAKAAPKPPPAVKAATAKATVASPKKVRVALSHKKPLCDNYINLVGFSKS